MSDILTATCNIFFWLQVARTNWFALLCCTYLLILFTIKWKVVEGISCSKCCKLYISETGIQYSCKSIERKSIAFLKKTNFKEKACKMPVSITRMHYHHHYHYHYPHYHYHYHYHHHHYHYQIYILKEVL